MLRKMLAALAATALLATLGVSMALAGPAPWGSGSTVKYEPHLDPSHFVSTIDNPYYPLPVGRTLIYRGVRDGVTQTDRVHVTNQTKVLEGITATAVRDVATHNGTVLEATTDWFAQDDQGNVWYLGEDTKAYDNGQVDTSGSWQSGVNDGEPGIIMLANPQIPDAYRQEYLAGQAEDTAWITQTGQNVTVPYGSLHNAIKSLEFTQLEPTVVDQKVYAPGLGIVLEKALAGDQEVAKLVKVTG
ncbi:MAG: hypothetical protein ACJ758_08210 [Actinomycetota bacterium]